MDSRFSFFFSSRRRHTRCYRDWSSDVCSSDLGGGSLAGFPTERLAMVHLNDAPAKPPRTIEDADRLLPGLGVIDLASLVRQLRAAGHEGPWSLETFNPEYWSADPLGIAIEGRSRLDRVLGRPARSGPGEAPWS